MNNVGALITKGLGFPANMMLITAHFHLFVIEVTVIPNTNVVAAYGGSIPMAPGEVHNFYKPVDPNSFNDQLDPSIFNHPALSHEPITIKDLIVVKVNFNGKEIEKQFAVTKRRTKIIVNVLNFLNNTKDRANAVINNLKQQKNKLFAKILNMKKKNK